MLNEVAADEIDPVPLLFWSACAAARTFYTYAKSRDLDIDEAILAGHFEAILALLDGYALWLQSGRQADNLVARIGIAATAPFPQIDPRTRDQYLRLLKLYLFWCVSRYIPRARQTSTSLANIEVALQIRNSRSFAR